MRCDTCKERQAIDTTCPKCKRLNVIKKVAEELSSEDIVEMARALNTADVPMHSRDAWLPDDS